MSVEWGKVFDPEVIIEWLLTSGVTILFLVIGGFVVISLSRFVMAKIRDAFEDDDPETQSEREKRAETLTKVTRNIIAIVVWGVVGMMILRELGVDIGPILAGAGVIGLAVGFGAQTLVKDFLSGMFILMENQFRVGDVIATAGEAGLVEAITLRTTILRDLEGKVHIIPNGEIAVVTNMTKKWSRFMIDVGVAYKEDVDHVIEVLKEVGESMTSDPEYSQLILEPLQVLGVDSFGDSSVNIRVMFTTKPLQQWGVGREFRRRIKNTFDEKGIEIPFPHTTLYLGEGSPMDNRIRVQIAGEAPPPEEESSQPEEPLSRSED
jgi:small conductance mechanosensitive channel